MPRNDYDPTALAERAAADSFDSLLRAACDISDATPSTSHPCALSPGDVLAQRFLIERVVGSGGMGTIHRGVDLTTREVVAIKVISAASIEDAERFVQEATAVRNVADDCAAR
jgi:serine/threonine protein kinase